MSEAQTFEAVLVEGHKQVHAAIVPFDPEVVWGDKPIKIDTGRDGWLVTGTVNGTAFDGWIGYRWSRFFIILDKELRDALGIAAGDTLAMVVRPARRKAAALAVAKRQAKSVTARR